MAHEMPAPKPGLLRLAYVSIATRRLSDAELRALVARCETNNAAAGITGLLVAQEPYYVGIMEGPARRVLARMEVIITDDRHTRLSILREEAIPRRRFANWSFSRLPPPAPHAPDRSTAEALVLDLLQRL